MPGDETLATVSHLGEVCPSRHSLVEEVISLALSDLQDAPQGAPLTISEVLLEAAVTGKDGGVELVVPDSWELVQRRGRTWLVPREGGTRCRRGSLRRTHVT